jgi:hypothetical protein
LDDHLYHCRRRARQDVRKASVPVSTIS